MAKTETFPFRYTLYALSLTGFIVSLLASTIWGAGLCRPRPARGIGGNRHMGSASA